MRLRPQTLSMEPMSKSLKGNGWDGGRGRTSNRAGDEGHPGVEGHALHYPQNADAKDGSFQGLSVRLHAMQVQHVPRIEYEHAAESKHHTRSRLHKSASGKKANLSLVVKLTDVLSHGMSDIFPTILVTFEEELYLR